MSGGLDSRSKAEMRRLVDAGPVLKRELERKLKRAGQDAARKTQAKIRGASSRHGGSLRAEIAATVTVTGSARPTGAAVLIRSLGSRMPEGKATLPMYANAGPRWRRWRHPVFGRMEEKWVSQGWPSAAGWFDGVISGQSTAITKQVQQAVDAAITELER